MKNLKKFWVNEKVFIISVTIVLILDKLTKWLIKQNYYLGESRKVLGNFFQITFIENKGIAFGMFANWDNPIKSILLFLLSILALVFIIKIYVKSEKSFLMQLSFGLILGGAIGNIFDRIVFGKVVDFLNFGIGPHRWPFFNIADSSITIGVTILIILTTFFNKEKNKQGAKV